MRIRVIATGRQLGLEHLYRVEVKRLWWWVERGYMWARSPQEALRMAGAEAESVDEVQLLERMFHHKD